jgi:hypothetical protein
MRRGFRVGRPFGAGSAHIFLAHALEARLGNLWVDSESGERTVEVAAEFAAGGLEGSLLFI